MQLPNDPVMLLSVINTELRDYYPSLDELCAARQVDADTIIKKLAAINYVYDPAANQFI